MYQCFVTCHVYCFCGPQEEQLLMGIQIDKHRSEWIVRARKRRRRTEGKECRDEEEEWRVYDDDDDDGDEGAHLVVV